MSATLRYDVGKNAAAAIRATDLFEDGPGVLDVFGGKDASRWGGLGKPRREVVTFAVKLPNQVADAWRLQLHLLDLVVGRRSCTQVVHKGCAVLYSKLQTSLGLSGDAFVSAETAFLRPLTENPGDLSTWSAYADWLQERSETHAQTRGWLMAAWLGRKAVKTKYGVPVLPSGKQAKY